MEPAFVEEAFGGLRAALALPGSSTTTENSNNARCGTALANIEVS